MKIHETSELNEEIPTVSEVRESRPSSREELTAELREEFAPRYEHDKGPIVEAVDGFIKERVEAEMVELAEDKQKVRRKSCLQKGC